MGTIIWAFRPVSSSGLSSNDDSKSPNDYLLIFIEFDDNFSDIPVSPCPSLKKLRRPCNENVTQRDLPPFFSLRRCVFSFLVEPHMLMV
jgi:hypothetical protein